MKTEERNKEIENKEEKAESNSEGDSVKTTERKQWAGELKTGESSSEDIVIQDENKGEGEITRDEELRRVPGGKGETGTGQGKD